MLIRVLIFDFIDFFIGITLQLLSNDYLIRLKGNPDTT